MYGVPILEQQLPGSFKGSPVLVVFDMLFDEIETQELAENALMAIMVHGFAAMLFDDSTSCGACGQLVINAFESEEDNQVADDVYQ